MAATGTGSWSLFADVLRQGVDTFAAYQKMLVDVAAQNSGTLLGWVEESLARPAAPGMIELAARSTRAFLESQRIMLDLAVQQSRSGLVMLQKVMTDDQNEAMREFRGMLEEAAAAFVSAQKRLLDFAGEQAEIILKGAGEANAAGASALAQMARLSAQAIAAFPAKQFLDTTSKQMEDASERVKRHFEALYSGALNPEFVDRSRQSFQNYITLQQKLTEQATLLMQDWSRAWQSGSSFQPEVTFADLARSGMESYVRTQQDLLEFGFQSLLRRT